MRWESHPFPSIRSTSPPPPPIRICFLLLLHFSFFNILRAFRFERPRPLICQLSVTAFPGLFSAVIEPVEDWSSPDSPCPFAIMSALLISDRLAIKCYLRFSSMLPDLPDINTKPESSKYVIKYRDEIFDHLINESRNPTKCTLKFPPILAKVQMQTLQHPDGSAWAQILCPRHKPSHGSNFQSPLDKNPAAYPAPNHRPLLSSPSVQQVKPACQTDF